jgi:hypothetical protein
VKTDGSAFTEQSPQIGAALRSPDALGWRAKWEVKKFWGPSALITESTPYEVVAGEGNLAMNGGVDLIWKRLLTRNPSTAIGVVTSAFSSKAAIGVGNSTATSTASQTDLQGGSKQRVIMDGTYPQHTTGTSTSARTATFRATFSTAVANFSWREWGVFNSTASQRMLNRKVQNLGTKTSAASWQFTVSITIS